MSTSMDKRAIAADASLDRVKAAWRGRLLANGVEPYDYETTVSRVGRWEDWPTEWARTAGEHETRADEADQAGHAATAAGFRRQAALAHHFGFFASPRPTESWVQAQRTKAALFSRAAPFLDPPAVRIEIPFEDVSLPAYLRRPRAVASPPLVLFVSGLDSTKEEHTTFENVLLQRGLATLTFDGPGQGEVWEHMRGRVDWEKAVSAVIDAAQSRPDVDASRIGIMGVSLGGYLATRSAALEPRIRAVAVSGGRFDQAARELEDPLHTPRLLHFWGAAGVQDLLPKLRASTLEGVIQRLDRPLLVVHGERDTLAPVAGARRIYDEASTRDKAWVLYPEGNHVCNNIPHLYRPLMADWLADRLAPA